MISAMEKNDTEVGRGRSTVHLLCRGLASFCLFFFRSDVDLLKADFDLCGDLVRDNRALPSHHLGRAWVVRERDKVLQVVHFSARLNLKQKRVKRCPEIFIVKRLNRPARGREGGDPEVAPSDPSRKPQSCSSAS